MFQFEDQHLHCLTLISCKQTLNRYGMYFSVTFTLLTSDQWVFHLVQETLRQIHTKVVPLPTKNVVKNIKYTWIVHKINTTGTQCTSTKHFQETGNNIQLAEKKRALIYVSWRGRKSLNVPLVFLQVRNLGKKLLTSYLIQIKSREIQLQTMSLWVTGTAFLNMSYGLHSATWQHCTLTHAPHKVHNLC